MNNTSPEPVQGQLAGKTARSAGWLVLRYSMRQGANTIAFFAIAAMLSPEAFGIGAIAVTIGMVCRPLVYRGFRDAVIQSAEKEDTHFDTAWWLNAAWGALLAVAVLVCAAVFSLVTTTYDLAPMTAVAALIPLFTGLTAVQEGRLERFFQHHILTIAQSVASVVIAAVAIAMAVNGAGAWALIVLSVGEVGLVALATFAFAGWIPGTNIDRIEAARQIRFARPILLGALFNANYPRLALLIIAAFISPAAAGFFRLGLQIFALLQQTICIPISQALLAGYSRTTRMGAALYLQSLSAFTAFSIPAFLGAAALAPAAVTLLLGPEWDQGADLSGILCFGVFTILLTMPLEAALIAVGRSDLAARMSIQGVIFGLLAVSIGAWIGLEAAAIGFVARGLYSVAISAIYGRTILDVSWTDHFRAVFGYIAAATAMYAAIFALLHTWPLTSLNPAIAIITLVAVGILIYVLLIRFGLKRTDPISYYALRAVLPGPLARGL